MWLPPTNGDDELQLVGKRVLDTPVSAWKGIIRKSKFIAIAPAVLEIQHLSLAHTHCHIPLPKSTQNLPCLHISAIVLNYFLHRCSYAIFNFVVCATSSIFRIWCNVAPAHAGRIDGLFDQGLVLRCDPRVDHVVAGQGEEESEDPGKCIDPVAG